MQRIHNQFVLQAWSNNHKKASYHRPPAVPHMLNPHSLLPIFHRKLRTILKRSLRQGHDDAKNDFSDCRPVIEAFAAVSEGQN